MDLFLILLGAAVILIGTIKLLDWALDQDRRPRKEERRMIDELEEWRSKPENRRG